MKKVLSTISLIAITTAVFAQGTISTINSATTLVTTNGSTSGALNNVAGQYYFAVLTSSMLGFGSKQTDTNIVDGNWTFTGIMETNIASFGRINGGNNIATTAGWAPGLTNSFIVVGWSLNEGATWLTVSNELATGSLIGGGYFGQSGVGFGEAGGGAQSLPPFQLFNTGPTAAGTGLLTGFALNQIVVPEPTTIALAGLSGLSLLLFRRKKS